MFEPPARALLRSVRAFLLPATGMLLTGALAAGVIVQGEMAAHTPPALAERAPALVDAAPTPRVTESSADDVTPELPGITSAVAPKAPAVEPRVTGRSNGAQRVTARRPRAVARIKPQANETLSQRGARLLASLDYDWKSLGYTVRWAGPRNGILGITDPASETVVIYVRKGHSDSALLETLAHELGHVLDVTSFDAASRAQYLRIRGLAPSTVWWPCGSCNDQRSGAGDLAETFAVWLVNSRSFSSQLAGRPSAAQLTALTPLFSRKPTRESQATVVLPPSVPAPSVVTPIVSVVTPVAPRPVAPKPVVTWPVAPQPGTKAPSVWTLPGTQPWTSWFGGGTSGTSGSGTTSGTRSGSGSGSDAGSWSAWLGGSSGGTRRSTSTR